MYDPKMYIQHLTVKEFRKLMQECFDADRLTLQQREAEQAALRHAWRMHFEFGCPMPKEEMK